MLTKTIKYGLYGLILGIGFSSCGTYYQKTNKTESALLNSNYEKAEELTIDNKYLSRKRNSLLYFLELGKIQHLQGEFEASNISLNAADDLMNNYRNLLEMAVGVSVNPSMQPYKAEPHEQILVHYYKALNYLQLGNIEEAIVEARRIDLSQASNMEAVNNKERKYGQDPFGMLLMGMIYEADRGYNNAFIAYRNAKEIYAKDESGVFASTAPASLESDLVRTAAYAGMNYQSDLKKTDLPNGEAIIFWENGIAPIKAQKDIFFTLNKENGKFFFMSDNLVIPIDYDFEKNDKNFKPSDIGIIRVAWSYYIQRPIRIAGASITHNSTALKLNLIEDISALAFQIERDNYFKDLASNLLRLTLKKISELSLSQKNEYAGLALNIANVATEKADTRNWQSLPSQIYYVRVPLEKGENTIEIKTSNGQVRTFTIQGNGRTVFRNFVTY